MGHKPRGVFGHGGGTRAPRHYSKFLDNAGVRLGWAIVLCALAFLLFVFLSVFV